MWHFVGVVLDRTLSTQRIKMYASLAGASTLTQIGSHDLDATESVQPTAQNMFALQKGDNTETFRGRLANLAIWNRSLTTNELRGYRDSPALVLAGRKFFAPLGFGSPEPDYGGGKWNGTLTGTTLVAHPPTGPLFGFDTPWTPPPVAAPGGGGGGHRELTTVRAG